MRARSRTCSRFNRKYSDCVLFGTSIQSDNYRAWNGKGIIITPTPTLKPAPGIGSTVYIYLETPENTAASDNEINAVSWPPDGKRIASTDSTSNTIEVWDAFTGGHQIVYRGHSQAVNALAWAPDGTRIASGSSIVQKDGKTTGDVQL